MRSARRVQRPRAPHLTRAKLIAAGKRSFARRGLHGTSVGDIAAEAGVSAAMINHHFGGKAGLYRECVRGFGSARLAVLERFLVAPDSLQEWTVRLEVLIHELLEVHLAEPDVVRILLRDADAAEEWGADTERLVYEFSEKLASYFALAQTGGWLRRGTSPLAAASVVYLSLSALLNVDKHRARVTGMSLQDPGARRAMVRQLLDIVLHGILLPEVDA